MRQVNYTYVLPNQAMSVVGTGVLPAVPGFTASGKYENVVVVGNYAYVSGFANPGGGVSLVIYDVADPTNPFVTGYIVTQTNPWRSGPSGLNGTYSMAVQNGHAYVASGLTFYVVDVKNPYNPFNVSYCAITGSAGSLYSVAMNGNYAYLATQNKGLTVVDCTNPLAPVQTFQEGGTTNKSVGVCVANGYAFTTNYQTTSPWTVRYLKVWNVSTPSAPTLLTTYTLPAGTKPGMLSVNGNHAYVTDLNTNTSQIVDISNVNAPSYVASIAASASFNVAQTAVANTASLNDKYAYIPSGGNASYGGAVDFYNITSPSSPVKVATYKEGVPASAGYQGSCLSNNLLYVSDYGPSSGTGSTLVVLGTQTGTTPAADTRNLTSISAQVSSASVSASGTYVLQGCDDPSSPTNWSDISSTKGAVSGAGVYLVPTTDISYQFIRLAYTNTGVGGLGVTFKALGS